MYYIFTKLKSPNDLYIRIRLLLEQELKINLQSLTEECQKLIRNRKKLKFCQQSS